MHFLKAQKIYSILSSKLHSSTGPFFKKYTALSTFSNSKMTGGNAAAGGGGYTFAIPGGQAYNVLPGNIYLPAQNSGYTVTYQKA